MKRSFFLPRSSRWHALYPLTKLAVVFTTMAVGFLASSPLVPLAICLFLLFPLAVWAQISLEWLRAACLVVLPFALSVFIIQGLFFPGGTHVIFSLGPVGVKAEGLVFAFGTVARILLLAGGGLLLLFTTHPADLMHALQDHGLAPVLAYVVVAALELVPQLQARAESISDAQQARGLEIEGSILRRIGGLLPLTTPLVLGALADVDERAMALEARAFSVRGPRTSFKPLQDTPRQAAFRWGLVAGAILVGLLEVFVL